MKLESKKILLFVFSLAPSAVILLLRPFGMSPHQGTVTAALILAIIWWITKLVDRTAVSIILLAVFCIFGDTPFTGVFTFPLSETFLLIILSFLFSEGVKNSGLLNRLLLPLLSRWATSVNRLLCSMLLVNFAMIFIIPQPFSRIILVAVIYDCFFSQIGLPSDQRRPLMLCLHISAILVNMSFLRGDIILNNALPTISGIPLSEWEWMYCMAVPSLIFAALGTAAFRLVFRHELQVFPVVSPIQQRPWTKIELRNLTVLLAVILLWATEDIHGISGTVIVLAGTAAMIPMRLLKVPDLKCIDVKLLIFLTAAFSIGPVLKSSGAASVIFSQFAGLFPPVFSPVYLLIILLVTMFMHMLLGSSITTMSVVIPSLMVIGEGVIPAEVLLFTVYIVASGHILLPFHNVITMIGEGRGYFQGKELLRYGAIMTIPVLLFVLTVFAGWWRLLGIVPS